MTLTLVLSTATKLAQHRPPLWPDGPYATRSTVGVQGDRKAYQTDLVDYLPWIARVEWAAHDPAMGAQWLRRLYYSVPAGGAGKAFDDLLATDPHPGRRAAPVTRADGLRQAVLDALVRTGTVRVAPLPPYDAVEMSHVFVLQDLRLNGLSTFGSLVEEITDYEPVFSWAGDLGSAWLAWNSERRTVRKLTELSNMEWSEPLDAASLVAPLRWLDAAIAGRASLADMLGDIDAVVLAHEQLPNTDTPITDLVEHYYTAPAGAAPPEQARVADRFAQFVARAVPVLPHAPGSPTTPPILVEEAKPVIRSLIHQAARNFLLKSRDLTSVAEVYAELNSPWGGRMFDELTERFWLLIDSGLRRRFLLWPSEPEAAVPYAGYGAPLPEQPTLERLEAVAQFYLNWPEPHRPLPAGPRPYRPLRLHDPQGDFATVTAVDATTSRVRFADRASLEGVRGGKGPPPGRDHRDLLELPSETGAKVFRVLSVDRGARSVVVEGKPAVGSDKRWRIHRRPRLVMVDPFFGRETGDAAVADLDWVTLDGDPEPDLGRMVANFDTIALDADEGRLSKTYRIVNVHPTLPRVQLDDIPKIAETSAWMIPAGISDTQFLPLWDMKARNDGCDHYDGVVFVVHGDQVKHTHRGFTSYTSSKNSGQSLSSCFGNARFSLFSFRSEREDPEDEGPPFRNYCLAVTRLVDDNVWSKAIDKLPEARFFFSGTSANRFPLPPGSYPDQPVGKDDKPPTDGKQNIRIHNGRTEVASGSDGCMVSPLWYLLRHDLIELHQAERIVLGQARDHKLDLVADALDHASSEALWNRADGEDPVLWGHFADRLLLELICIRPDQRPTVS